MKDNSLISVIVPVYNVEDYLERCIDSLLGQDYNNLEIILVDDGSTDKSGRICDDYLSKDSRIKVYHKSNGGLSDARNYGLERASGKYILFVDSDDYIVSAACSCLLADAEKNNADMVIGHARLLKSSYQMKLREDCIRENFEYHRLYSGKEYLLRCLEKTDFRVEAWRSLYSADFLNKNELRFEKGITHEDELFTPVALIAAKGIVLSDLEFYVYDNDRQGSIINSKQIKKAYDRMLIHKKLLEEYKTVAPNILKKRLMDNLCWKYLDTVVKYRLADNPAVRLERFGMLKIAYTPKRRIKALVFAISPKLYCRIFK